MLRAAPYLQTAESNKEIPALMAVIFVAGVLRNFAK